MATPVLADLRAAYPKAHLTAMCRSPMGELLRDDPRIDELICFSKGGGLGDRRERTSILQRIRSRRYDLGILLTHSFSSAWWFWRGNVKYRIGYAGNGRALLLHKSLPLPENIRNQHLVVTYKMLLQPLGIPISDSPPRIHLTPEEKQRAREVLQQKGIGHDAMIVGINPGATYGSAKCWLPERFRAVTERLLQQKNTFVIYFGDYVTTSLVNEICQDLAPRVVNLAGTTPVRELAAFISLCHVLLTNDSGPMHIADALGTPVLALFGSTSEVVTGPYRSGKVIHKHVECSPCYLRTCPIDFRCMKRIEADEVFREIMNLIEHANTRTLPRV